MGAAVGDAAELVGAAAGDVYAPLRAAVAAAVAAAGVVRAAAAALCDGLLLSGRSAAGKVRRRQGASNGRNLLGGD